MMIDDLERPLRRGTNVCLGVVAWSLYQACLGQLMAAQGSHSKSGLLLALLCQQCMLPLQGVSAVTAAAQYPSCSVSPTAPAQAVGHGHRATGTEA